MLRMYQESDDADRIVGLVIGREIAAARTRKRLTQQELADAVGMAQSSIKNYELANRVPRVDHLVLLARALDADAGAWLDAAQRALQQVARPDA